MGFIANSANRIREFFRQDKESLALRMAKGTTAAGYPGSGMDLMQAYGYDVVTEYMKLEHDLLSRYVDYEEMDDYPELSTSLDIYADDSTQYDSQTNRSIWVESPDNSVQTLLDDLLHKTLRADEDIWTVARNTCRYGNNFEEILVNENGVIGLNFLPAPTVRRIEGPRGELFGFLQDFKGKFGFSPQEFQQILASRAASRIGGEGGGDPRVGMGGLDRIAALEDWEVAHFRLPGKQRRSVYGYSVLESARWIYKRLVMLEDAALIYRLQRAPERYAFYVDVGDLPPAEALAFVNRVRQQYKKAKYFNPTTGKLDLKFNAMPVSYDTPIPLLDGRVITIEEMAKEHASGKKHWVYSINRADGSLVPGEVSWVGKTRESSPSVKITFDDGGVAVMAPDHPVMRRDCSYVNADSLKPGDSVMPFYRRNGTKSAGDLLDGYELVYNPVSKAFQYTHRIVSWNQGLHSQGQVIHHKNFNKRDNEPSNLIGMRLNEHTALHCALGHSGGKRTAEKRKTDKNFDLKLRKASSRNITAYNKSEKKRSLTSRLNVSNDSGRFIRIYNASPKHAADNSIRSSMKRDFWKNESKARTARERMSISFPEGFVDGIKNLIVENPSITANEIVDVVNKSMVTVLSSANRRDIKSVHRHMLLKMYRKLGADSFLSFKNSVLASTNHKVVKVEKYSDCDHYCMTVEKWHNFSLLLRDGDGSVMNNSGVFVKNSQDEDFFVPSRKGQEGTRIDTLGAPVWQAMQDIEYFRDKMFAAIKIPKAYMAQDQGVSRQILSSEDVRFARTILRVQRELRNGYSKVCRVHMMALNIDPYQTDYDIRMTVPSSIFELAQLEVRNARADLAGRMQAFVPLKFLLSNIFGYNDSDIEEIIKGQEEDAVRMAVVQAKAAVASQKYQQENAPPPPPGQEMAANQELQAASDASVQPPPDPTDPSGGVPEPAPQAPGAASPPGAAPVPPSGQLVQSRQRYNPVRFGRKPLNESRLMARGGLGITEEELFRGIGSPKSQREMMGKFESMLKENKSMAIKLLEIRSLVEEIRMSQRRR